MFHNSNSRSRLTLKTELDQSKYYQITAANVLDIIKHYQQ